VNLPTGAGTVRVKGSRLSYSGRTNEGSLAVEGEVSGVGVDPELSGALELKGLIPQRLLSDNVDTLVTVDGKAVISGKLASPEFAGRLLLTGDIASGYVDVDGSFTTADEIAMRIAVASDSLWLEGQKRDLELMLAIEHDTLKLRNINVSKGISARGTLQLAEPHSVAGTAIVESLELSELLSLVELPGVRDIEKGRVWLTTDLGGTLADPLIDVDFSIRDISFRGTNDLELFGAAEIRGSSVVSSHAVLARAGREIGELFAEGPIGSEIRFHGHGSDLGLDMLSPELSGKFDFDISSSDESRRELLRIELSSSEGSIRNIEFGDLLVSGAANRTFFDVYDFEIEIDEEVRFSGYGEVPYGFGEGEELGVELQCEGNLLSLLPYVVPGIVDAEGTGKASILLVGTIGDLTAIDGSVTITNGYIEPELLVDRMKDVDVDARFEDGVLVLDSFTCEVGDGAIEARSFVRPKRQGEMLEPLVLSGIYIGGVGIKSTKGGISVNIPNVMRDGEWASASIMGQGGEEYLYLTGPYENPLIWGRFRVESADFMLPEVEEESEIPNSLVQRAQWDLEIVFGKSVWFINPRANVEVQEGTTVLVLGSRYDGSWKPMGTIHARKGTLTFLGNDFILEEGRVEFPRFESGPPRIIGKARTRVEDGTEITLTLDTGLAGLEELAEEAIWSEQVIQLSSDRPAEDDTQEKIWEKLLYGRPAEEVPESERFEFAREEVTAVMGQEVSELIVQPIIRPIEHRLRRALNLDLLRIKVQFAKHVIEQLEWFRSEDEPSSYTPFLNDTGIAMGKYFSRDLFLGYEALVQNLQRDVGQVELGFRHELSMEYRLSPGTVVTYTVRYRPDTETWESGPTIENRFRF
jgi:hypothetical protein